MAQIQYINKFNSIKIIPIYPQVWGYTGVSGYYKDKMKKILTFILILTLQKGFGQEIYPFEYLQKMDYFDAYTILKSKEKDYKGDKYENEYWQALGTIYCFMEREDKAFKCFQIKDSILNQIPEHNLKLDNNRLLPFDTLYHIIDNYNVVMLNEAHHVSSDRALLYYLLPILKKKGFTQLALEALNNEEYQDTLLQKRGYPIYTQTGIYLNDPVYANVIRLSLKLGYTLIPYESYQADREKDEANNLINGYSPNKGKMIVYAGYAHISKSQERQLMGYHFKKRLNEDYLSLSQYLPLGYDYQSSIIKTNYQLIPDTNNYYDYFVIPQKQKDSLNISGWYAMMNFKYALLSNYYKKDFDVPALIQVFNKNEKEGIPVFQYLIEDNSERNILLTFPKSGDYKLKIVNQKHKIEKDIRFVK